MLKRIYCLLLVLLYLSQQANAVTRAERWTGSVRGCLSNSTTSEWKEYGSKLPRFCTCLANQIVKMCATSDSTSNKNMKVCVSKKLLIALKNAKTCLTKGTEPHMNPYE